MNKKEIQILTEKFADSLAAQNDSIKRHDPVSGNQFALEYINAAKTLIRQGQDGINALAQLLHDPRRDVRGMAAAFLIPFRTDESKAVLKTLIEGEDMIAFESKITLERWERERRGIDLT
ncbi:hypothetical protein [Chthoniobacter flavus]|uniref:hypothetical protein n=1 Tax=Chthoniobacter flavus TaxID=191863 RepID=UPI00104AEA77|nr:hypothetical protein [Chthoniobacter flavus]